MIKPRKLAAAFCAAGCMGLASLSYAADTNVIFVVDESGSMSSEHQFLDGFVAQLALDLASPAGGNLSSSFGLVGYGSGTVVPITYPLNAPSDLGTAAEFAAASNNLRLDGGTEDGYDGIDHALQNIVTDPNANVAIVLVTDEDRDIVDSNVDFSGLLSALGAQSVSLTGIINQRMESGLENPAIGTDGTVSFIADGAGGFTTEQGVTFTSSSGTTEEDYTDLAIAAGGCVGDLNFIRNGGTDAQSFSAAFLNCLVQVIQEGGGLADRVAKNGGLNKVIFVNRRMGIAVGFDYFHRLAVRRIAAAEGSSLSNMAMSFSRDGQRVGYDEVAAQSGVAGRAAGDPTSDVFSRGAQGFWVGGHVELGDLDATATSIGAEYDVYSLVGGYDFLLDENTVIGFGAGVVQSDSDLDAGAGSVDIRGLQGALYGSYTHPSGWYGDLVLAAMKMQNDIERNDLGTTYQGEPDSTQLMVSVTGGFKEYFTDGLAIGPFVTLNAIRTKVEGYTETVKSGPGVATVTFGEDSGTSFTAEAGASVSRAVAFNNVTGVVTGRASLVHEFGDGRRNIFAQSGATAFTIPVDGLDQTYGRVGFGGAIPLDNRTKLELDYKTLVAHSDLRAHQINAEIRVELD